MSRRCLEPRWFVGDPTSLARDKTKESREEWNEQNDRGQLQNRVSKKSGMDSKSALIFLINGIVSIYLFCYFVFQVSVYLQNWSHVLSYVNKAEATPQISEVRNYALLLFLLFWGHHEYQPNNFPFPLLEMQLITSRHVLLSVINIFIQNHFTIVFIISIPAPWERFRASCDYKIKVCGGIS